jgi:A/G-specific adenine glycosylase
MGPLQREEWNAPLLRRRLLRWYEANRRDLPWRRSRDPYSIWVSEIMLQQTRVAVVVERYIAFLSRFPDLESLARAQEQDVLALWSGLGYYRRARMLHQAGRQVALELGGVMPRSAVELRKLPGIGAYTAAAIASIAHGEPVAVVDGNVERVLCRLAGWDSPTRTGKSTIRRKIDDLAMRLLDPKRPGDYNQAMMELGATVCLPRNPKCLLCPLLTVCVTRGEHKTAPRAPMLARDAGCALCVRTPQAGRSAVLLEQRPASASVMPSLWELPALRTMDVPAQDVALTVRHAIMQVNYRVRIRRVSEPDVGALTVKAGRRRWIRLADLSGMALTGLARKVLARARLLSTQ